jgi:Mn2+/Fe2+ NRAMP family transporter
LGYKHRLEHGPREAPWFYATYTASLVLAGVAVVSGINLVTLGVGVQVMNALLLPIVLGFLYLLARRLPAPYRLEGTYAALTGLVIVLTAGLGVYAGLSGLLNG